MKLLKLHGPKKDADYRKAQNVVMLNTPSETAIMIRDLICKKKPKLTECCCGVAVETRWLDVLPRQLRTAVANLSLADDWDNTCDTADRIWASLKAASGDSVAALQMDDDPPAGAESVAAVKTQKRPQTGQSSGNPRGRGHGRGQGQSFRGRGRGARNRPPPPNPDDRSTWGDPHEDGPPPDACMNHYRHGRSAYCCRAKSTCSWRHISAPPKDD